MLLNIIVVLSIKHQTNWEFNLHWKRYLRTFIILASIKDDLNLWYATLIAIINWFTLNCKLYYCSTLVDDDGGPASLWFSMSKQLNFIWWMIYSAFIPIVCNVDFVTTKSLFRVYSIYYIVYHWYRAQNSDGLNICFIRLSHS